MIYEDFHLRLAPDGHDGFQVHASFQEQSVSGPLLLSSELWLLGSLAGEACAGPTRHLGTTADSSVRWTSPEEVGSRLFQALLGGEVGRLFNKVHGAFEKDPGRALRLRLHFPSREKRTWLLQSLPWELLYHPDESRFLALDLRMPIVRSVDTLRPIRVLPPTSPLRALIVMASPAEMAELNLSAERNEIEQALARIGPVETVVLRRATRQELRLRLREERFHIVHFMGHGVALDERSGEGALLLHGLGGEASPLSATLFTSIFQGLEAPQLVVLNACETAAFADGIDPVRSVAASLVVAGLPAVLAMRAPILDDLARLLAEELYRRLALGEPIEAAVTEARLALLHEQPEANAWAIPALFIRPDIWPDPASADDDNPKILFLLAASLGSLLPGFAFFMEFSPPLRPEFRLLPVLAAAAVVIAFVWPQEPRVSDQYYKRELRRAATIVLVSLFFVLFYIVCYRFTTVSPPVPPPTITCQTGFGLNYLTESAGQFINRHPALANPQDLMLAYAAFAGCRTDLIWEGWSISVAGVILMILLLTASLLWAFGFAWLARLLPRSSHSMTRKVLPALVLLATSLSLCSCMSERLSSGHATATERIKYLEEKARELDGRTDPVKPPAQSSNR